MPFFLRSVSPRLWLYSGLHRICGFLYNWALPWCGWDSSGAKPLQHCFLSKANATHFKCSIWVNRGRRVTLAPKRNKVTKHSPYSATVFKNLVAESRPPSLRRSEHLIKSIWLSSVWILSIITKNCWGRDIFKMMGLILVKEMLSWLTLLSGQSVVCKLLTSNLHLELRRS